METQPIHHSATTEGSDNTESGCLTRITSKGQNACLFIVGWCCFPFSLCESKDQEVESEEKTSCGVLFVGCCCFPCLWCLSKQMT